MTQAVTYVEIDVPHCSLTYSTLPCRAQLGFSDTTSPNGVKFGGSYGTRGAGLTGAADSGKVTGSFWVRTGDDITTSAVLFAGETTLAGSTVRFQIRIVSGTLRVLGINSGGTTVLDIRSSTLQISNWYHCLFSVDLSSTALRHLYIDDVSDLNVTTYTVAGTIDFTLADWSLGALANGTSRFTQPDGAYADFWLSLGVYTDFSTTANRRLFIDANLRPVFLGTTGQVPTGSSPIIFFGNPYQAYQTNLGTGGGFTLNNAGEEDISELATGTIKCFNSLGTCQDLPDFTNAAETVRFGEDVGFGGVQTGIDAYPFIKSIDFQPAIISLEGDLGQRATVKIIFNDSKHPDIGVLHDHYASTRPYTAADTYERGTFWGKFRARHTFLREAPLRLIRGVVGQSLAQMETRYFIVDSIDGPDPKGQFTIIAKDILKMADGDRALAPTPNTGSLSADITNADMSFDVVPAGAGAQYIGIGTSIYQIGGSEIIDATVAGDTFTVTARGHLNTEAQSHNAGDRVQAVLYRNGTGFAPSTLINTLLQDFAGVPSAYIPITDWDAECAAFLNINYTLAVAEPTSVNEVIGRILEQSGSIMWWDDLDQRIRFQVLREIPTTAQSYDEDNVLANTMQITEQPIKRVSQVIIYYNKVNPLLNDEPQSYASMHTETDTDSEFSDGPAVKTIFANYVFNDADAQIIAQRHLSRHVKPPRRFNFEVMRFSIPEDPNLGSGARIGGGDPSIASWPFSVDATGERMEIPVQITRHSALADRHVVEAEELNFTLFGTQPLNKTIVLDADQNHFNLRTAHDDLYGTPFSGDTVTCIINAGVIIGAWNTSQYAFDVGTWPAGVTITVGVRGRIEGKGGGGGNAPNSAGSAGGVALYTRKAISLILNVGTGQIWGGGGGGGAAAQNAGGGGAGQRPGNGGDGTGNGENGDAGLTDTGGTGGSDPDGGTFGGAGGGPGLAGTAAVGAGGATGKGIDGTSFCTKTGAGDIRGGEIN